MEWDSIWDEDEYDDGVANLMASMLAVRQLLIAHLVVDSARRADPAGYRKEVFEEARGLGPQILNEQEDEHRERDILERSARMLSRIESGITLGASAQRGRASVPRDR